jgi:hypothetical protein
MKPFHDPDSDLAGRDLVIEILFQFLNNLLRCSF